MLVKLSLLTLACCALSFAQEFRSTLSGRITDQSGASVPNAKVVVTETATGAVSETTAGAEGEYTLPFLAPGSYSLKVAVPGFKEYLQSGITIGTNQRPTQDIILQVGSQTDRIEVIADVPLLSTATASVGQVISSEQIESMPMNGRTSLTLAQLAYGVTPASDPRFTRPFDNGGPSGFSMGGGQSQSNELLLDGAPDMTRDRRVAYNPPVDAVKEVKVEAFQPDAAYGNTAGGTVNMIMKTGTNDFHGSLYEFNQVSALKATPFFTNAAGQRKPVTRFNQYGGTVGGPVWIPKLWNGRNKAFFFFAYEGIKQSEPEPTFSTVPTDAERRGDFSALRASGIQIYDPSTAVFSNGVVTRTAFPNNIIPAGRISPVAQNILSYLPAPNAIGTATGVNNRFDNALRRDNFDSYLGRLDLNLSERHRFFFNMRYNDRLENRGNRYNNIVSGNFLGRVNWGATFDDVFTVTPTLLINTRLNWSRFREGSSKPSNGFDPTSLGLPAYIASNSTKLVFPRIDFPDGSFTDFGDEGGNVTPFDAFQIFENITKVVGEHSLKFGADLRKQVESSNTYGNSTGSYTFNTDWTRAASNLAAAPIGQDLAALLLGLPTGGNYQINATRTQQSYYYAFFLQDDWHARRGLTFNMGLRYEAETGTTERYNRAVSGFDPNAILSITPAAEAAYRARPTSLLPADAFRARGGVLFANPDNRAIYNPYKYNFSPRFGFAWSPDILGSGTVIRGGVGLFVATYGTFGVFQPGFSSQTALVSAAGGVYTAPIASLADPFPTGIAQPVGASLGVNTFLGQNVTYNERKLASPNTWRWNFNVQRSFGRNTVMEVGYMGSETRRLPENRNINFVPQQYLSASPIRDQATITLLSTAVANPFAGLLPGTSLNGATTARENLLRPFPQFSGENGVRVEQQGNGYARFHMLQTRFERRFAGGLQFLANYQFSKFTEATTRLYTAAPDLAYNIANEDRPHRFVFSGSYELPFGKNKRFLSSTDGFVDRVVGGWKLNTIYSVQSGPGVDWGNVLYYGGDLGWNARNLNRVFDVTRFERAAANQLDRNVRTFGIRFPAYRADKVNNVDISLIKTTPIAERARIQLRAECFNAFNRTQFNAPELAPTNSNFGRVTSAANLPRSYQLALRLVF